MNKKVISLSEKRQQKKQAVEKNELQAPSSEVIKLWRLSMDMDDLIKSGVGDDKLPPEEIAAIFANRLGTLIHCCDNSYELAKFCMEIIERINKEDVNGKGA